MGKNEIDIIILGSFLQGPAHGYQLKQRIDASFGQFYVKPSTASIYTRLQKFEAEGYIEGRREQQDKLPDRKIYQITEAGKKRLFGLVATPIKVSTMALPELHHLIVHAIFFSFIPKESRKKVVQPFVDANLGQKASFEAAMKKYGDSMDEFTLLSMEWGAKVASENVKYFKSLMAVD